MEAEKHISRSVAGGVLAVTVVVVFTASSYAIHDEAGSLAAFASANADTTGSGAIIQPATTTAPEDSSSAADPTSAAIPEAASEEETLEGRASYYGFRFAGKPTANGEAFDPMGMTAAHRTLPFGSRVRVTNTANGRSVVVRINDRGPFLRGRIIDLSRGAAERIGMIRSGLAEVEVEVLR